MKVVQSCPTLCDSMDCSLPGSSVHGILQARILGWVAIPFSGDLPNPGTKPRCPTLQADSLPAEPPGDGLARGLPIWLSLLGSKLEAGTKIRKAGSFKSSPGHLG